jgi:hypothetical protein
MTSYKFHIRHMAQILDQAGESEIVPLEYLENDDKVLSKFFSLYCSKDSKESYCVADFYELFHVKNRARVLMDFLKSMGEEATLEKFEKDA